MSQICSFCGCPLEEGCGVCPNCGSPVSGGEAFDTPVYSDPALESVSGEEFSAVSTPEPEPASTPKASTTSTPKAVSVPKASDYDHIIPTQTSSVSKASTTSTASAPATSSVSTAKPKKKRGCCGCGCCLPVLIVMVLSVFLIFSGIAGEIFDELGIPVDLSEIEMMLNELYAEVMNEMSGDQPETQGRPDGNIPADAVEFNGHYYYLYTVPVDSIAEAIAICESNGGYWATVTSDEESLFLYDYILSLGLTEYAYLGGSDFSEDGAWYWYNGEPFTYTNWNAGEPNDDLDGEDNMAMHRLLEGGAWNDIAFTTPSVTYLYPEIVEVEASSVLNGKSKYSGDSLIDGDLFTAWNEGSDGITGESVTQYFSGEYQLTGLEMWGGFQYSDEIYYANARPATVELTFSDGSVLVYTLEDVRSVQYITFDEPITAEWVTMTVTDSFAGTTYKDLCISELYYHCGVVPVTGFLCEWGDPAPAE